MDLYGDFYMVVRLIGFTLFICPCVFFLLLNNSYEDGFNTSTLNDENKFQSVDLT